MMTVYDILKQGLKDEGSDKMWCITKILSDSIDQYIPDKSKDSLMTKVYYGLNGGHFDKEFADRVMSHMYYTDSAGIDHYAPYWTDSELKTKYEMVRSQIPEYNFYDFVVTINMIKSDNHNKLHKWFPNSTQEELFSKYMDETINYLQDKDNPFGTEKVWKYLNS